MTPIAGIARQFFDACEAGKGWNAARPTATRTPRFLMTKIWHAGWAMKELGWV
jgi:hypothetical protein